MINLIPNEEKKKMSKDFYFRLITVSFFILSILLFIASASILPSYFLSKAEKNSVNTKLDIQKKETISESDKNTVSIVKDLNNKMVLIENAEKNKFIFSERIINEIVLKKLPNIKITGIYYKNGGETGEIIDVVGKAASRNALLLFRRALEDDAAFSKVNLPISNFVKGSNINFNLTLIPS